jgi:hypothetical protein
VETALALQRARRRRALRERAVWRIESGGECNHGDEASILPPLRGAGFLIATYPGFRCAPSGAIFGSRLRRSLCLGSQFDFRLPMS